MSDRDFLATLAGHVALATAPLRDAVQDLESFQRFMYQLGWDVESLPAEYTALGATIETALTAAEQLQADPSIDHIIAAFNAIRDVYHAARDITGAPVGVDAAAFLDRFADRLFELLLVQYLASALPDVYALCQMTGVITATIPPEVPGRPLYVEKRFHFSEIPVIAADPLSLPARIYGWGTAELDFGLIIDHLQQICLALFIPADIERVRTEADVAFAEGIQAPVASTSKAIDQQLRFPIAEPRIAGELIPVDLLLVEFPGEEGKLPGMALRPSIPSQLAEETVIAPDLTLRIRAGSDIASTFGIILRPGEVLVRYPFAPGTVPPAAGFQVTLDYHPDTPTALLGRPDGSRVELAGARSSVGFEFRNNELEFGIEAELLGLRLLLLLDDQDSFLGSLFSGQDLAIDLPLGVRWTNRRGLSFTGGAGFEVTLAPHKSLGPVTLDTVHLSLLAGLGSDAPPSLTAGATVGLHGALGPIGFTLNGVGVKLTAIFEPGNLGPLDLSAGFVPPTGMGLVVDTTLVTGGGALDYDPANGRYAGMLQLRVGDIGVTAIGLLDTRVPGAPGTWSFLIIVSGTFPPIQLGYGFTLEGVGGLAGVHRTMVVEAIQSGMRNNAIDHILFPEDPVANANQIISDLRTIFPPARGRYVFGPMALIGWGQPRMVKIELGILLELPTPIRLVILGQLSVAAPTEEAPLIELHLDILGILDCEAKRISVDAVLRDSRIAAFALSGEMAFRFSWGAEPMLVLSVGGLNPHYQAPPGFPTLQPIMVALGLDDNPRISLKGYLARTSNTFQMGALAELYAAYGGFSLYGWIGFDALFIFKPFSFVTDFSGGVKLSRGSTRLAAIHLNATLSGTSPFHAKGRACLSLWLFDICVSFDQRFGLLSEIVEAIIDAETLLLAAIRDPRNWSATLPAAAWRAVSASAPAVTEQVLIDPVGGVTLLQRVLPLNRRITRFGDGVPAGPGRYDITGVQVGNATDPRWDVVQDQFAPAQFEQLTDAQKLSLPSFARMDAGVEVAGKAVLAGPALGTDLTYETRLVDAPWSGRSGGTYHLPLKHQVTMLAAGAASRAPFRKVGAEKFSAGKASLLFDDEPYTIVSTADLALAPGFAPSLSKHDAFSRLAEHLERHPEDRSRLQAVPRAEVAIDG